ncbi:MAG: hypothetical protein IT281_07135 [Ignavibacteria bacterium]|nr:hypothetical protein [Ignavibacteria bacterium]
MNYQQYNEFSPSQIDMSGEYARGENRIPARFLFLYLLLAGVLCYLYHKKIVAPADWNGANSLNSVASFETRKPYQFRLLLPMLFWFFKPLAVIYGKYLLSAYNMFIVFFIQVFFYKLLCSYFKPNKRLLWIAPVILYTMLWNYIILNESFQYYDFTAILFSVLGLYFIVRENFAAFFITLVIGIVNKETAGYLIFSYVLYNYRDAFKPKIIVRAAMLSAIFIGYKLLLGYVFRNNPGDPFEIGMDDNIKVISTFFSNKIIVKNILLNFGGLYVFAILLFVSGWWKKFPDKRLIMVNLTIIPYYVFGFYITYMQEVRVYTELIPMMTILFLIFLSNFKLSGLDVRGAVNRSEIAGR